MTRRSYVTHAKKRPPDACTNGGKRHNPQGKRRRVDIGKGWASVRQKCAWCGKPVEIHKERLTQK